MYKLKGEFKGIVTGKSNPKAPRRFLSLQVNEEDIEFLDGVLEEKVTERGRIIVDMGNKFIRFFKSVDIRENVEVSGFLTFKKEGDKSYYMLEAKKADTLEPFVLQERALNKELKDVCSFFGVDYKKAKKEADGQSC